MIELNPDPKSNPRNLAKSQGSAWRIYGRLLRYAWRYKARLMISLLFAILVAISFTAMLVSAGTGLNIILYNPASTGESNEAASHGMAASPPSVAAGIANGGGMASGTPGDASDPAAKLAARFADWFGKLEAVTGWTPSENPEKAVMGLISDMRADKQRALFYLCAVLVVLAFIGGAARFIQEYFAGSIGANISVTVAKEMYANVLRLPLRFFETRSSGEILARFTNDVFMINRGLANVLVKLIREPIKALAFLSIALSIHAGLTLIGLCVLPPVAYVILRIGKKIKKSVRRSLEKIASMAAVVNETFRGIAIIKSYCMERSETKRLHGEIEKLRKHLLRMVKADASVGPLSEFIMVLGVVVFVLVSGREVAQGSLTAGSLVTLYGALAMMLDPVRKLSTVNNLIQTSVASGERVFELIDMESGIVEAEDAVSLPRLQESLEFDHVHFGYEPDREVLRGIDLTVRQGEMVAIVGFSGAGKSTLAKLIPRFYDVTGGAIRLDGVDIRKATFESLRGQISIVPQETLLFNLSVRENIAFGNPDFTEAEIIAAAKAAYAHEFIEGLPHGYESLIGESGISLSGGQRQRIAIARALIKNPAILILDEATSSLDSESERAIQKAFAEFVVGRTTLVIAHRLSTVMKADRIVVMDQGRIVEEGPHQALMNAGGIYQRLYQVQFAASMPA